MVSVIGIGSGIVIIHHRLVTYVSLIQHQSSWSAVTTIRSHTPTCSTRLSYCKGIHRCLSLSLSLSLSLMAPKRKAPGAPGRAAKRVASGVNTPVSMGSSDDDYSDYGDVEETEYEPRQDLDSQSSSPALPCLASPCLVSSS